MKKIKFNITEFEKQLIKEVVIFEPFLLDNLAFITKEVDGYLIEFDHEDLTDLISALHHFQIDLGRPISMDIEIFQTRLRSYLVMIE